MCNGVFSRFRHASGLAAIATTAVLGLTLEGLPRSANAGPGR